MTVPVPESIRATAIEAAKKQAERRYPHNGSMADYQQDIFRDVFMAGAASVLPAVVAQVQADTAHSLRVAVQGAFEWPDPEITMGILDKLEQAER